MVTAHDLGLMLLCGVSPGHGDRIGVGLLFLAKREKKREKSTEKRENNANFQAKFLGRLSHPHLSLLPEMPVEMPAKTPRQYACTTKMPPE